MKAITLILFIVILASSTYAALTCTTSTTGSCATGETAILKMSNDGATDRHAATPAGDTGNSYNNVVCCSGATGLGTSCSATNTATLFSLEQNYDSHLWLVWPWLIPTPVPACISSTAAVNCGSVTDVVTSTNTIDGYKVCTNAKYDTCIATMSGDDGHVGSCSETTDRFDDVVCCSAAACDFPADVDQDCLVDDDEYGNFLSYFRSANTFTYQSSNYKVENVVCHYIIKASPYFGKYDGTWTTYDVNCGVSTILRSG